VSPAGKNYSERRNCLTSRSAKQIEAELPWKLGDDSDLGVVPLGAKA